MKSKQSYSRQKARRLVKSINKYADLPRSQIVHHLDEDPLNNDLGNLTIISDSEHTSLHWLLNPDIMGRKPDSLKQMFDKLDSLLITYNHNK